MSILDDDIYIYINNNNNFIQNYIDNNINDIDNLICEIDTIELNTKELNTIELNTIELNTILYILTKIPIFFFTDGYFKANYINNKERGLVKYINSIDIDINLVLIFYLLYCVVYYHLYVVHYLNYLNHSNPIHHT